MWKSWGPPRHEGAPVGSSGDITRRTKEGQGTKKREHVAGNKWQTYPSVTKTRRAKKKRGISLRRKKEGSERTEGYREEKKSGKNFPHLLSKKIRNRMEYVETRLVVKYQGT